MQSDSSLIIIITLILATTKSELTEFNETVNNSIQSNRANNVIFKDKTYYFYTFTAVNWFTAFEQCQENGQQSLTINSQQENDFLAEYIENSGWSLKNGYSFWSSGTNLADNNKYFWFSTGKPVTYTSWAPGDPNNEGGNEHCIQVYKLVETLLWNDYNCNIALYVICESKAN